MISGRPSSDENNVDWAPSLKLRPSHMSSSLVYQVRCREAVARNNRMMKRGLLTTASSASSSPSTISSSHTNDEDKDVNPNVNPKIISAGTNTDTDTDLQKYEKLSPKCEMLEPEARALRRERDLYKEKWEKSRVDVALLSKKMK